MDLLDEHQLATPDIPLAARMRPRTLDEFIGQDHILAPGRLLRRAIQADQLSSVIFSGPPGTGKTTLARIIANTTKAQTKEGIEIKLHRIANPNSYWECSQFQELGNF